VPPVSRKIVTRGIFGKYRCPRLSCSLFLTERWFRRNNKMISGLKCPQKYRYDQDSSIRSNFFARSDAVLTYCISQYWCMICKQCILYWKLEVLEKSPLLIKSCVILMVVFLGCNRKWLLHYLFLFVLCSNGT